MELALTALGWLAPLWCAAVTLSSAATIVAHALRSRGRLWNAPGWPVVPLEHACVMLTALALLGVLPEPGGAILAAVPGVPLAIVLAATARKDGVLRALAIATWLSPREGATLLRGAVALLRGGPRPRRAASPAPATPAAATPRTVPLLREDTALGPPPAPEEAAAGAEVPVPFAELAGWIAGFVAEDDNAQLKFLHDCAAGLVTIAQAFGTLSETAINEIGLDPSYGNALLEFGARIAECAGDAALVNRRYLAIYGALKQMIEDGLVMPYNARQFLGGGSSTPGTGGTAAA